MRRDWILWAKCAAVRAIKTVAETAAATLTTSAAVDISEINWWLVGSSALLAGIYSLLTSLSGIPEAKTEFIRPNDESREGDYYAEDTAEPDND